MQKRQLTTIFVVVFIDLLGFGVILPLLPYYAETFGADPTQIGFLVASYAAAQLIGAPMLGRLSDKHGRRPVLLLSIFGQMAGFLILGFAQSMAVLFASRILAGLTGGNISVAQAYITDVTDERSRAKGLGLMGAAFGLGFIFGPALGGSLSGGGFALPSFVAAGFSLLNLMMVALWLPESLAADQRAELASRPAAPFTVGAMVRALGRHRVGPLLQIRFFFGLAFATFQSVFALYALYRLGMSPQETGFVLAYVGLLSVLIQGVAIGRLTAWFSDDGLIMASTVLMAGSMLAWAFVASLPWLLVVLAPLSLAGGVMNTVINSALTKAVRRAEYGGTLGIAASVESSTRVIAPTMGGWLLQVAGTSAPGIFAAAVLFALAPYAWLRLFGRPDRLPEIHAAPELGTVPVPVALDAALPRPASR